MTRFLIASFLGSFVLLTGALGQLAAASYKTDVRKPADKVQIAYDHGRLVLEISSSDGIGSATISPANGKWPPKMLIRLNLNTLEFIRISAGKAMALEGRLGSNQWTQTNGTARSLPAVIRRVGGFMEIEVPDGLLQANPKEILVEWINQYR